MSIPGFTIDGIIPPFTGMGPGNDPSFMSPYEADALEVVLRFGTSGKRREILEKWLDHRTALRGIGFHTGFQWLDGSFLEEKEPNDLDIVTFVYHPADLATDEELISFWNKNSGLLDRDLVKADYLLDAFFLDLSGSPEGLVSLSRYYLQLFSHQRESYLWKGMIQVPLEDANDNGAREQLLQPIAAAEPMEE
ncbi:MAG TPA: hypothetical protein VGR47_22195 [Terracidiphilus sp.]|nr:hypothetical protein [Terracidiphilus sp.]